MGPQLSFKARTIAVVLFTSAMTALVACGAFLAYDRVTFKETLAHRLDAHGRGLAAQVGAAVAGGDTDLVQEALRSIEGDEDIVYVGVFDVSGAAVVEWRRDASVPAVREPPAPGMHWSSDRVVAVEPLTYRSAPLGTLVVGSDLSSLDARLRSFSLIVLLTLVISLGLAALITSRLQATLVGPVRALAAAAARISRRRDFSLRAVKVNDDEVGSLTDAFNQMLAEIEAQQRALERTSQDLESLVEARTFELERAMTEVQQTAECLRASERRFRSLSTHAPIGIFQVDSSGQPTYLNPYLERIAGARWRDASAADWVQGVHADDRPLVYDAWRRMVYDLEPLDVVCRVTVDGALRWLHVCCLPMAGALGGFVGTAADITERRRVEAERNQLVDERLRLSREAGMAEIATNVLHNVGNVLNSVNVSATTVAERLEASSAADVVAIASLLKAQGDGLAAFLTEDPRGKLLPSYLATVGDALLLDQRDLQDELSGLIRNVDHIKRVVSMQQSFARVSCVEEAVHPTRLVEEAVQLGVTGVERYGIRLDLELLASAEVMVDKHKVLQILVNLLTNARHAVASIAPERRIVVRTRELMDAWLCIEVEDSGVGIEASNLERLFGFGYTTRREGHGFGLHSSANTAQLMGGSLRAHSDGLGRGAVFALILPRGGARSAENGKGGPVPDPWESTEVALQAG